MSRATEILVTAREILGPNGEYWVQGVYERGRCTCLEGAINKADHRSAYPMGRTTSWREAVGFLNVAIDPARHSIAEAHTWNDTPGRKWGQVCAVLDRAIEISRSSDA